MHKSLANISEVIICRFVQMGRDEYWVRHDVYQWSDEDIRTYAENLIAFGIIGG